jgi:DNA-binding CsgD family transcriptional regulator
MARLGRPREVRERLARLSREIEGDLVDLRVRHVSALARADPAELDAVSHEFERWGLDLLAAEASAEAVPAWRARAEPRLASHAEHRAAQLAERCEGAATPALLPLRMRAQLTPAELRVVLRASSGQSNKDIAAELRLSPRTVGNHLQHAYEKLGVRGRAELPQLVGPGGDLAPLIE